MRRGRPLKIGDVNELSKKCDEYFATENELLWTITGLALFLDCDRDTLLNYEGRPEMIGAVRKAKNRIENAYERDLRRKGRSGDIFALKNFGWRDERSLDHTTKGEKFNLSVLSTDSLLKDAGYADTGGSAKGDSAEGTGETTPEVPGA